MHFMGKLGLTIKNTFLTFTLSVNKIIIYQFSMFKSLDSTASVVGIFMYLTISKFTEVSERSQKGVDYNTEMNIPPFVHPAGTTNINSK